VRQQDTLGGEADSTSRSGQPDPCGTMPTWVAVEERVDSLLT
jgi:hypothetical protein